MDTNTHIDMTIMPMYVYSRGNLHSDQSTACDDADSHALTHAVMRNAGKPEARAA